jgi:hypothetical protein
VETFTTPDPYEYRQKINQQKGQKNLAGKAE